MMKKVCSKCQCEFECKADDVLNCHCSSVKLDEKTQKELVINFEDCLCGKCLAEYALKTSG